MFNCFSTPAVQMCSSKHCHRCLSPSDHGGVSFYIPFRLFRGDDSSPDYIGGRHNPLPKDCNRGPTIYPLRGSRQYLVTFPSFAHLDPFVKFFRPIAESRLKNDTSHSLNRLVFSLFDCLREIRFTVTRNLLDFEVSFRRLPKQR